MTLYFQDRAVIDKSSVRKIEGGGIVATAKLARTGIQIYTGDECGKPEMATVRVYRSPEEVFDSAAMASYAHKPVTVGHPDAMVDSSNYSTVTVGHLGQEVVRDGDYVSCPILVMDQTGVDAMGDAPQFSMGYAMDLDWTAGVTPQGEAYDCKQTGMRMNHAAIVDHARGGSSLTVDEKTKPTGDDTMTTRTIVVDGHTINLADADTAHKTVTLLMDRAADLQKQIDTLTADAATAAEAKAKVDGELVAAKQAVVDAEVTPERMAKMVQARASLIDGFKTLTGKDADDKALDTDIRREAVKAVVADGCPEDDAAVGHAFDALVLAAAKKNPNDPLRSALDSGIDEDALLAQSGVALKAAK